MNRRHFLYTGLSAAGWLALSPLKAGASMSLADRMASVAPMLTDNDEFPLENGGRPDMIGLDPLGRSVGYNLKYWEFEQLSVALSPFLESAFEMFFLVNTDTKGSAHDPVPFQHIKVIRKIDPNSPVFTRNENGSISGFTSNAELWALIPISSGDPSVGILTYSGIFRFNHVRSRSRFGTNESQGAPMSYSSYIDFVYNTGAEAGVAIHGTPPAGWKLLGKERASHGCMRTLPEIAKKVRDQLFSPEMWSENLPKFDIKSQVPSQALREGNVPSRPGIKAVVMIFNGYRSQGVMT